MAYLRKGEYDRAIADLSDVIRIEPDYVEAYRARAEAFTDKGEVERARRDRERATSLKHEATSDLPPQPG